MKYLFNESVAVALLGVLAVLTIASITLSEQRKNREIIPAWPKTVCYQYVTETFQVNIKGEFGLVLGCVNCAPGTTKLRYVLFDSLKEYYNKVDCAYAKLYR